MTKGIWPPIRSGIGFAILILATTAAVKVAAALGVIADADVTRRATMAMMGAFLMYYGNAIPKTLTPLSAGCDAARAQAAQRLAGWTWVLAGLGLGVAWVALPVAVADAVSTVLLAGGMLVSVAQLVRLRRTRHRQA
jgi:hypothetical protein